MSDDPIMGRAAFNCPHCGAEHARSFPRFPTIEFVYCDETEGGCGATFAAQGHVTVTATATAHKIDGMEPSLDPDLVEQLRQGREADRKARDEDDPYAETPEGL